MAAWIAFICGVPFFDWLDGIVVKGSFRLSAPIVLVVFGAMFARVIQKTNISDAIIKKAAELSGDKPIALATLMTAATAFVFFRHERTGRRHYDWLYRHSHYDQRGR